MIVLPDECVFCCHVGIELHSDEFASRRCQKCGGGQPDPPGAPCDWCGAESHSALGKAFCKAHYLDGMHYFFEEVHRRQTVGEKVWRHA
jgi:hypothetical protein